MKRKLENESVEAYVKPETTVICADVESSILEVSGQADAPGQEGYQKGEDNTMDWQFYKD